MQSKGAAEYRWAQQKKRFSIVQTTNTFEVMGKKNYRILGFLFMKPSK